jgi:ankyrin repeat protein
MTINKYNVRAIRSELESCIRYNSWSKFRRIFQPLDPALQQAVVKEQIRKSKQNASPSLLYTLCRCIKPSSHPPVDIFESVLQVSPPSFFSLSNNHTGTTTPLSTAIDRQAPSAIIEVLLQYDEAKESLYQKGRGGDTPILAAIRHRRRIQLGQNSDEAIVQLLLRHDRTKQSLLIPSKTKQRVPLYYVASQEIPFLSGEDEDEDEEAGEIDLDEGLEYLLIQTFEAIEIQHGRTKPHENWKEEGKDDTEETGFFFDTRYAILEGDGREKKMTDGLLLLHATLACAHLLGSKNNVKLIQYLIKRTFDMKLRDEHGNSILHHACRAIESNAFLELCFVNDVSSTRRNLLQHLISKFPEALALQNSDGETPLHLAIRSKKSWAFLRVLCPIPTAMSVLQAQTNERQLALHLAIEHYPPHASEILQLWNCYPEAATILDGKQRLFAFQLVAAFNGLHEGLPTPPSSSQVKHEMLKEENLFKSSSRTKENTPQTKDMQDLQLIFFFLKAFPQVLQQLPC